MHLNPLPKDKSIKILKSILDGESWNICIITTTGHFLIGEFFIDWEQKSDENKDKIWFPKCSMKQPEDMRFGIVLEDSFRIVFNTPEGKTHGNADLIEIPFEKIADIKKLAWQNPELKKRGFKNISNPLASIISKCNLRLANESCLEVFPYCEMALAHENVGEEGIYFNDDESIYIDIDYFNNIQGSIDVGPMSFGSSISAYAIAYTKLQNSILQRTLTVRKRFSMW